MDEAEILRTRYRYRKLIASGDLRISRAAAVPLVGPDCAYHLYAFHQGPVTDAKKNRGRKK